MIAVRLTHRFTLAVLVLCCGLLPGCTPVRDEQPARQPMNENRPLPPDARIVFLGDSITEAGAEPAGYVTLVADALRARYPAAEVIGAGISGNKVPDLQARLDRDVLSKDPTHVVVYIGINDVWHWTHPSVGIGTEKDAYRTGLRDLLSRIRSAGAEVFLCTPSVIGEDPASGSPENRMLDEYAAVSREVAAEAGAGLCDLRAAFTAYLKTHNPDRLYEGILTSDGVHLNEAGNRFVAEEMLKVLE